ncbi:MAG: DedA family protein [Candidatus Binataceae bacterium]
MHHVFSPTAIATWLAAWGYLGVFIFVFVGNLGVPVPEETVLLAAGFIASRGLLDLKTLCAVGIASAVAGDCCGFLIGRTGGQRLIEWLGRRFPFIRRRYDRLQKFFNSHGSKAVFMARFIAGARFMAGPMAGAAGMPFWRFLGWNLLGAVIWCTLIITVGYLVGDELEWIAQVTHMAGHWIALGVFIVLAAVWIFWWRERQPRSQS